jgi:putative FmdB family regulatory protein
MPFYEYKCPNGHVFERFQRMSDPPPEVCDICGEGPVESVLFPVAVHFKGSGFYSTDYGRGSRRAKDGSGDSGGGGGESSGGESSSSSSDSGSGGSDKPAEKKAAEA